MLRLPSPVLLGDLVDRFGGRLVDSDHRSKLIFRLSSLEGAQADDLGFVTQGKYLETASRSSAGALIASAAHAATLVVKNVAVWIVDNPYATYARVSCFLASLLEPVDGSSDGSNVHSSAVVDALARVHESAFIGPNVVIEAGAQVEANVRLISNVFIGRNARVGHSCLLNPGVVLYQGCSLGARNIVHSGTVIGSDGFGFAQEHGQWVKIAQLGAVVIGDDVEIGSNCSIDRGAIEDTVIGNGVKIDNLVQIAHNVQIGDGTAIAGCVGIAGSAVIGKNCAFGGSAGVLGHLEICDNVTVSSMSLVTRSIDKPGFYSGVFPLQDNADWERVAVSLKQLPQLRQRLRELERLSKKNEH
jgi:UDP-3-O-[3-hydroxymyristoyl] glucosamine N-acyltransferase